MAAISSLLWIITTLIVIISGIYLRFNLSKNVKKSFEMSNIKDSIKLLNLNLASKIGVGSISGIAVAMLIGGAGSIFWIWISSIFLAPIIYIETKVGIKYRDNNYIGGPEVYLKTKLNKKLLSTIYSVLIIFTYLFAFILIQSNTIVISFEMFFKIKKELIVLGLSILTYCSINKGITKISNITSFLAPIMSLIYIVIGVIVII